jgi:hypothetical protein
MASAKAKHKGLSVTRNRLPAAVALSFRRPIAPSDLCNDLKQAQHPVEDDAIEVFVHAITSLA